MLERTTARAGQDILASAYWLSAVKAQAALLNKRTGLLAIALSLIAIGGGYLFLSISIP
jgi:hypothetical protein